jgi:hypothetical protein
MGDLVKTLNAERVEAASMIRLLSETLQPFADGMHAYEQHCHDEMDWVPAPERYDDEFVEMLAITGNYVKLFKIGQLRAARSALQSEKDREELTHHD